MIEDKLEEMRQLVRIEQLRHAMNVALECIARMNFGLAQRTLREGLDDDKEQSSQ